MGIIAYRAKEFLGKRVEDGGVWNGIYYFTKYTTAQTVHALLGDKGYAKWFYRTYTGDELDLDNPIHLNEKLWALKLTNRDPQMTLCSDKYAVRQYVAEQGFPEILIPELDVLPSVKELDFKKYPEEVIAKCNHNSGGHIFYDPKAPLSDKELDRKKRSMNYIMHKNASVLSLEWNYKNIKPLIVVDRVIRNKDGSLPLDYRFFCFDGEPKLLMMDIGVLDEKGRHRHVYPRNLYDMDFKLLPIRWGRDRYDGFVEKPKYLEKMIEISRKLSQPFPFCRVDLYNIDGRIFFGEITFYHGGASQKIEPEEWDLRLASWIDLDSPKIIRT